MDPAPYILVGVSLILILLFFVWVSYTTTVDTPATQVYFTCPRGYCPTNIYNGEKRCPVGNEAIIYDPSYEVCNSRYACDDRTTPYALLPNGATNSLGLCASQSTCRCLTYPTCPSSNVVLFSMKNGNLFSEPENTSRAQFSQISLGSQGDAGSISLAYTNPSIQFCAIKAYHLNRVTPGACILSLEPTVDEIVECFHSNPCVIGVLAFQPVDANYFILNTSNVDAIYGVPVACVPGDRENPKCTGTQVPVWDGGSGQIVCYDTA